MRTFVFVSFYFLFIFPHLTLILPIPVSFFTAFLYKMNIFMHYFYNYSYIKNDTHSSFFTIACIFCRFIYYFSRIKLALYFFSNGICELQYHLFINLTKYFFPDTNVTYHLVRAIRSIKEANPTHEFHLIKCLFFHVISILVSLKII